jgi:hypothetical protein
LYIDIPSLELELLFCMPPENKPDGTPLSSRGGERLPPEKNS